LLFGDAEIMGLAPKGKKGSQTEQCRISLSNFLMGSFIFAYSQKITRDFAGYF